MGWKDHRSGVSGLEQNEVLEEHAMESGMCSSKGSGESTPKLFQAADRVPSSCGWRAGAVLFAGGSQSSYSIASKGYSPLMCTMSPSLGPLHFASIYLRARWPVHHVKSPCASDGSEFSFCCIFDSS